MDLTHSNAYSRFTAICRLLALPCVNVHSHDFNAPDPASWSTRCQWCSYTASFGQAAAELGEKYATFPSTLFNRANIVLANYDTAMKAVAFIELIIMARVFLGALTFRNSLMTPLFYAHFLRQRYYQSQFTRIAVTSVKGRAEEYVRKPGSPPILAQIWDKFIMIVARWAGSPLAPQQTAPAGGQ